MYYHSTRDKEQKVTASQAIIAGLATDGGLYIPERFPKLAFDWETLKDVTYQELAYKILAPFLDDFSEADLKECIAKAYDEKFDTSVIAPLVQVGATYHLELFHGATMAFKDMALSLLPYLMEKAIQLQGVEREIIILTATSGDTGKAAMAGFADVPGTRIIVFYPEGGVSAIQERQMLTQTGSNIFVRSVIGNFDEAQTAVKNIFTENQMRQLLANNKQQFSSANSMNIGRLLPQIVYYFSAYLQLVKSGQIMAGEAINVTVPTGNFGDILAAYYAKRMGLPLNKLVCASNENKVLYDFFETGTYDKQREFKLTSSPSMDILISSNFERLLYHVLDEDTARVNDIMSALETQGHFSVTTEELEKFIDFEAGYATEEQTRDQIKQIYEQTGYVMDPHTAVASFVASEKRQLTEKMVVVSTASPYKFPETVLQAITTEKVASADWQTALEQLHQISKMPFPTAIKHLFTATSNAKNTLQIADMRPEVERICLYQLESEE